MSTTDTPVTSLIANKLPYASWKAAKTGGTLSDTELYEITDIDTSFLEAGTKYGASISLSINSSTYVITAQLKDQDGNNLGSAQTIDLPLESVVVNGAYDNTNKKIILTLDNGNTIDIPVGDLVAGLQTEITSSNKLDADLVDDSTSTNKFVTSSDISTWNAKQDAISDLATIRSGASAGATALQPNDNISELINDAGYITSASLPTVNNATLTIQKNGTAIQTFTANASSDVTANITVPTQASDIGAQETLVSGTNIKTVNNTSLLGSGNITIDSLPTQSGQSGKFLTTDGTDASWATVDALPSQTSQSGKFLTTDGSSASWATVPSTLPTQTGQSGKFLTTDGTDASWANVDALPSQSGQSGKYLTTNGTTASWSTVSASVSYDGDTINENSSNELQAIGVIEKNAGNVKYDWVGTLAQWQAGRTAETIPDSWFCYIIDDESTSIQVSWSAITDIPTAIQAIAAGQGGSLDSGTMGS